MTRVTLGRRTLSILALLVAVHLGMQCGATVSKISIDSPANGVILDQASVLVSGSTTTQGPDMVLEVNGVPVTLVPAAPGFTWSTTVNLDALAVLNPVEAVLKNGAGFLIDQDRIMIVAGPSIADGADSPQALGLRINDTGLDELEPVLASLVDLDLAALIPVGTVILPFQCFLDLFGCIAGASVSVVNPPPNIGSFSISVNAVTDAVGANIFLSGLSINAFINGTGLAPDCGLELSVGGTNVTGNFGLGPDLPSAAEPVVNVVQNGSIGVTFANFNSQFDGICDAPIIGDIIQALLPDIKSLAESGVASFLNAVDGNGNTPIAAAIETALDGIEITGPIGATLGLMLQTDVADVPEDTLGITIDTNFKITTENGTGPGQCVMPAGAPDLTASYHVPEPFPSFGATTPISGLPYDVALCVSSSAFNQLMKGVTECGALNTSVTELSGTPITASLLGLAIDAFQILPPATPLEVRITPSVAPLVTGNLGAGGEIAELLIGQLQAEIVQDLGGPEIVHLNLALDVRLGFDLTFDGVGLVPSISPVSAQDITVFILDNRINAAQNEVLNQVPDLVAPLIPGLASFLGAIPIPELLGLSLSSVSVERNGQFISVFMDASVAP